MRAIRLIFFVVLAIVLILVATANRAPITVGMMPQGIADFTGRDWTLTMPGFLALFLAMVFGVMIGLIWEWLREAHLRANQKPAPRIWRGCNARSAICAAPMPRQRMRFWRSSTMRPRVAPAIRPRPRTCPRRARP